MGYNTTVVVLNDALGEIEDDPEFGKKLVRAILEHGRESNRPTYVSAQGKHCLHCNAAEVIESHHADYDVYVKVGGNTGEVIELPPQKKRNKS